MRQMSEREINEYFLRNCRKKTPDLWKGIEDKLQFQKFETTSYNNKKTRFAFNYMMTIISAVCIILVACCSIKNFNFGDKRTSKSEMKVATDDNSNQKNNLDSKKGESSLNGPCLFEDNKCKDRWYRNVDFKLNKEDIGKCIENGFYEIKGLNPSEYVAMYWFHQFIPEKFIYNSIFTWQGIDYEITHGVLLSGDEHEHMGKYLCTENNCDLYAIIIDGKVSKDKIAVVYTWYYNNEKDIGNVVAVRKK